MRPFTSCFEGGRSWITVQSDLIGWSFETSEQQKKTLFNPLYLSNNHLMYSRASVDSLSASHKIIAAKKKKIDNILSVVVVSSDHHLILMYMSINWNYVYLKLCIRIPRVLSVGTLDCKALADILLCVSFISSTMTCLSYPFRSERLTSICCEDSFIFTWIRPLASPCDKNYIIYLPFVT